MTAPSRDFLVQQSILNASEYLAPLYSRQWMASWFGSFQHADIPPRLHGQIVLEFRALTSRYGVSP